MNHHNFELQGTTLTYQNIHNKKKSILIQTCNIVDSDFTLSFKIETNDRIYELEARNLKEKKEWIEALQKAKIKNLSPKKHYPSSRLTPRTARSRSFNSSIPRGSFRSPRSKSAPRSKSTFGSELSKHVSRLSLFDNSKNSRNSFSSNISIDLPSPPNSDVIKSGILSKKNRRTARKSGCHFQLQGTTLTYLTEKGKEKRISVNDSNILNGDGDSPHFKIITKERTFELEAENLTEKKDWVESLRQVQQDYKDSKVHHVKFTSHKDTPWGIVLNLDENWYDWQVKGIIRGKQADILGVKVGDRPISMNKMEINNSNWTAVDTILSAGNPCSITFSRQTDSLNTWEWKQSTSGCWEGMVKYLDKYLYCVISDRWGKIKMKRLTALEDPDKYMEGLSHLYSSVMFRSEDQGKHWSQYKTKGTGKIKKIIETQKKYLSNKYLSKESLSDTEIEQSITVRKSVSFRSSYQEDDKKIRDETSNLKKSSTSPVQSKRHNLSAKTPPKISSNKTINTISNTHREFNIGRKGGSGSHESWKMRKFFDLSQSNGFYPNYEDVYLNGSWSVVHMDGRWQITNAQTPQEEFTLAIFPYEFGPSKDITVFIKNKPLMKKDEEKDSLHYGHSGIVLNYISSSNWEAIYFNPYILGSKNTCQYITNIENKKTVSMKFNCVFKGNEWQFVKLSQKGAAIEIFLNDEYCGVVSRSTYFGGKIGFLQNKSIGAFF